MMVSSDPVQTCFSTFDFQQVRSIAAIFSKFYKIFENILHGFLLELLEKTGTGTCHSISVTIKKKCILAQFFWLKQGKT